MSISNEDVRLYLKKLNLDPEIANIYLALIAYGPQPISQLSRHAQVERTRVYRLLEEMKKIALVEIQIRDKRSIIKAAPIGNLQALLSQREQELRALQDELHVIEQGFIPNSISSELTKVNFFQGEEGVKQMAWNQTHAKTNTECILYENMQGKTGKTFFERWVRRCNERGLRFRGLIGEHFISTQRHWYSQHQNERLEHWEPRYISPSIFPITHSVIVYDNVVSYYNWKEGEVFGIEMHNQEIADAQRKIFSLMWARAQPVDDLKGMN